MPRLSQFASDDAAAAAAIARQALEGAGLVPPAPAPEVEQMDDDAAEDRPAPAAAPAAAAAELEGDILQENPGYLLIYYGPETTSDDRFPLNLASCGSVLRELNNLAVGMDDCPLFESNEISLKGSGGPITAHGLSWDNAQRFAENNECVTAQMYDKNDKLQQVAY